MFDILTMPPRLSEYELDQRLIIVAKKEDDNLRHLLTLVEDTYPQLAARRWLIVDDEAKLCVAHISKKRRRNRARDHQ